MYDVKENPFNDPPSRYPRIEDMVATINKMSASEMRESTDISKIPLPARQSLMVFLRDWRIDDPGHERFMQFIPEGFPQQEALMMADLLSFAMVEGEERKKSNKDPSGFVVWKRWQDELQPFYKKLPKDLSITDLIGLHCELLNMLPQKNYSQYTITQLFAEDETMLSSLVGEKIKISPLQFEALTMLTRMVEKGAVEQFKLAMTKGSTQSLIDMAKQQGVDIGSMVLDAFKIAQQAAGFFQTGDFKMAVEKMDLLTQNYEIGVNSFAEGLDQMFVATMCALRKTNESNLVIKGIQESVLMSLDLSFPPQGFPEEGYYGDSALEASARVRKAASMPALGVKGTFGKYGEGDKPWKGGTYGLRPVTSKQHDIILTTDWYALFKAFASDSDNEGNPVEFPGNRGDDYKKVFGGDDKGRPILRFTIHAIMSENMDDLLPKGLLTVALQLDKQSGGYGSKGQKIPQPVVDLFFQDFDKAGRKRFASEIPTIATPFDENSELQSAFEDMDAGVDAARKARKKSSKKRVTQGQLIAIDLTPSSHVRLSQARDRADYFKMLNKEDKDFKDLWNKYGRGNKPIRKRGGKYQWRGREYASEDAVKKAIAKEGSYADYKSGQSNMRLIYAPRKDNGNLVPFRLVVPKIMVRQEGDRLVAKSGSADTDKVKKLLDRLEKDFGKLKFKLKPLAVGGYDRYRSFKKTGDGNKDPITRVDRGVFKVFQAQGLEAGERFSTNAHPSGVRPTGALIYSAMTRTGQAVDMEVR